MVIRVWGKEGVVAGQSICLATSCGMAAGASNHLAGRVTAAEAGLKFKKVFAPLFSKSGLFS
jgi:hypothetical protein